MVDIGGKIRGCGVLSCTTHMALVVGCKIGWRLL